MSDNFEIMSRYPRGNFEEMTARAIDGLPNHIKQRLKNVAVCVEEKPTREQMEETGTRRNHTLLGLYEGIPETQWGKGFGNNLPDKITIFQEGIERFARTPEEIEYEVRATVWHEVGHYFGFDDKELEKLEEEHGFDD